MKGSLVICSFFAAGLLLGLFRFIPEEMLQANIELYLLCGLLFFVGVDIGRNPHALRQFRSLNTRLLLLPLCTIIGTLSGIWLISLWIPAYSLSSCLAVGSGFGYYSLSSILISEYKGVELGTIALLANIFREMFTLLLAPWMVKYFGCLAPIAAGGATTMDVTLPCIMQYAGKEYGIVSVYHGIIVDFSVPFLVTFFCLL